MIWKPSTIRFNWPAFNGRGVAPAGMMARRAIMDVGLVDGECPGANRSPQFRGDQAAMSCPVRRHLRDRSLQSGRRERNRPHARAEFQTRDRRFAIRQNRVSAKSSKTTVPRSRSRHSAICRLTVFRKFDSARANFVTRSERSEGPPWKSEFPPDRCRLRQAGRNASLAANSSPDCAASDAATSWRQRVRLGLPPFGKPFDRTSGRRGMPPAAASYAESRPAHSNPAFESGRTCDRGSGRRRCSVRETPCPARRSGCRSCRTVRRECRRATALPCTNHQNAVADDRFVCRIARIRRGEGEQVAGDVLSHQGVVRQVVVERADHVIAVGPGGGNVEVEFVAVSLGKPHQVEPVPSPPHAVVRRCEQPLDDPLVSGGRVVGEKVVDFLRRRREAGQIEGDPPQERAAVGRRRRCLIRASFSRLARKRSTGLRAQDVLSSTRRNAVDAAAERTNASPARQNRNCACGR